MASIGEKFPAFYPILDVGLLKLSLPSKISSQTLTELIVAFAEKLVTGGAKLIQYRNKLGSAKEMLEHGTTLRRQINKDVILIMNDRADLALAAGFDGVHLGQDDMSVDSARRITGPNFMIGVSTHNLDQLSSANQTTAIYVAYGPIFSTSTKENPDPVVGLKGLQEARRLTAKPLVAIGGITRGNCKEAIVAGADSVAVISELLSEPDLTSQQFCRILL